MGGGIALAQDALSTYKFDAEGRTVEIPSLKVKPVKGKRPDEMVSLKGTAEALGASLNPAEEAGSYAMLLEGTLIRFSAEYPSIVKAGDRVISLSRDARRIGSDLYLPSDFLTRVVTPILKGGFEPATHPGFQQALNAPAAPAAVTPLANSPSGGTHERSGSPTSGSDGGSTAAANPSGYPVPTGAAPPTLIAAVPSPGAPPTPPAPAVAPAAAPGKGQLVVIDPGHGGTETGATGKTGLLEKEVTLDVAQRLKAILTRQSGVNVLLTRTQDDTVGLDDRTALANQTHAELFVSIHVNSAPRRDARGAETYYLSDKSKNEEIRTLAAIENNAAGVDRDQLGAVPAGLDLVLWDLAQTQYLQESNKLAEAIQKQLNDALGVKDRGIKQAPFRVLMGATMPAVLVEIGFISNPAEETSLKDNDYRERIALAVSRAVLTFLADARRTMPAAAPGQR
jgi:N-acetylmuramoyl-L-alanine amidase